jgi:AcrR family transcriptional regulator
MSSHADVRAQTLPPWVLVQDTPKSLRHPEKRTEVVRAALAIADRDGFPAVSMRRVAAELGWGTMTLYSYVANKEQLIVLMAEELGNELLVSPPLPDDWREAITAIARSTRSLMLAHPWMATVNRGEFMSPAFARHIDQTFEALASLDVDASVRNAIARSIDDFTHGATMEEIEAQEQPGGRDDDLMRAHIERMLAHEPLPHLARAFAEGIMNRPFESHFEQGLAWLIAGIDASLPG